jgi:hypothetical protein
MRLAMSKGLLMMTIGMTIEVVFLGPWVISWRRTRFDEGRGEEVGVERVMVQYRRYMTAVLLTTTIARFPAGDPWAGGVIES